MVIRQHMPRARLVWCPQARCTLFYDSIFIVKTKRAYLQKWSIPPIFQILNKLLLRSQNPGWIVQNVGGWLLNFFLVHLVIIFFLWLFPACDSSNVLLSCVFATRFQLGLSLNSQSCTQLDFLFIFALKEMVFWSFNGDFTFLSSAFRIGG